MNSKPALFVCLLSILIVIPASAKDIIRYKRGKVVNFNAAEYERNSYFLGVTSHDIRSK